MRQQAIQRGTVSDISWSSVQRLLAGADIRPHHVEGWLHRIDPELREKATRICPLYPHPPPDSVVVCVDEMPGVQALRRKYPDHWGRSKGKRQRRREFEYVRGGAQAMIAGFEVQSGEVIAHCGDNRSAASLELFMEDLAAKYPTVTPKALYSGDTEDPVARFHPLGDRKVRTELPPPLGALGAHALRREEGTRLRALGPAGAS